MEKIIALNHKMTMEYNQTKEYINFLKKVNANWIVFPTAIYVSDFIKENVRTGLQNISLYEDGAYTGEISAKQAESVGVSYVLIGHSERRDTFNETDDEINKKILLAQKHNLKVILCVGEKENECYKETVARQLLNGLRNVEEEVIIAYEPVWAIGGNKTPNNERIDEVINYIKTLFNYDVKVLYGGSVNSQTIGKLKDVAADGYLIGGGSTSIDELSKIKEVMV